MRSTFTIVLLLTFLVGCGRIPEPVGYDYSVQQKFQAVYHWEVLANDVANQINNELIRNDFINTPVFVKETCGDDAHPCTANETPPFNESFRDLLITSLVGLGVPVSSIENNDAITVNYKTQMVYHSKHRLRTIKPGAITALTAGVLVLRNAPSSLLALGIAAAIDMANASVTLESNYEVVVTTSLVDKDTYLFRQSDIYYINDADFWHYVKDETETGEIEMTNSYFSTNTHSEQPATKLAEPSMPETVIEQKEEPAPLVTEPQETKPDGTDI